MKWVDLLDNDGHIMKQVIHLRPFIVGIDGEKQ